MQMANLIGGQVQLMFAIVQVLGRADVKDMLFNAGAETVGGSPEQLAVMMKSDTARLSKLVKDAGIRSD